MIIGVLNTLVQADTSSFDRGMQRAGQVVQQLGADTRQGSASLDSSLRGMGASGLLALSRLGPQFSVVQGWLTTVNANVRLFTGTIAAIAGSGTRLGAGLALIFSMPLAGLSKLLQGAAALSGYVTSLFAGAASSVGAAFGRIGGLIGSIFGAIGNVIGGAVSNILGYVGAAVGAFAATLGLPILALGAVVGGAALGIIGGFAAIAAAGVGLAVVLSHIGSAGAESIATLSVLSREMGFNVHALSAIANTSGLNPEAMAHSVLHMQRSIEEGSTAAAKALNDMGLSLGELRDMAPIQQLEAVYANFKQIETQTGRAAAAMALFGRSGITMLDSLNRGSEGLEAARRKAERFGLTFTEAEATAVRSSLRAWGQWSLAMEGVSRKLAVMFAPIWESIGNLGGNIGERLVALFSDRRVTQAVHGIWNAIEFSATQAWDSIYDTVRNFWNNTLGLSGVSADDFKEIFIKSLIAVEWAIANLGPLAEHGWTEIKLAAMKVVEATVSAVNGAVGAVNWLIDSVASRLNTLISAYNQTLGRFTGQMAEIGAARLPEIPTDGITSLIEELETAAHAYRSDMVESFQDFMQTRLAEIREVAAIMGNAADTAVHAARSTNIAFGNGGNGAALAGSEEAYRILESRQGNAELYARDTAQGVRNLEQVMRDVLQQLRQSPVLRQAEL